ncbi:MAG: OsmC family protein [Bacteroidota bacterium]|nr:OsmC family protein [Bacteroidota bacterium]
MSGQHTYHLTTIWTGNNGAGTKDYRSYSRSHTISLENKGDLFCSSDPSFRGDKTKYNPEELLVAALSGCHMLSYLHLCANAGIVVTGYTDHASGIMEQTADGGGHFTEVTLRPHVVITDESMIEKATELHHQANRLCFIASSCNFPVNHQPSTVSFAD